MNLSIIAATFLCLFIVVGIFVYLRYFIPLRSKEEGFTYVFVDNDGLVRELSKEEEQYLSALYWPGDGSRPYIKNRYSGKNGQGGQEGYILRRRVPRSVAIQRFKNE